MDEHTHKDARFGVSTWHRSTALSLVAHAGLLGAILLVPRVWSHAGAPRQTAVLWAGFEAEREEPFDDTSEPERVVDPAPLPEPDVLVLPVPHEPEPFPEELPPTPLEPVDWASGMLAHATLEPVFARKPAPEETTSSPEEPSAPEVSREEPARVVDRSEVQVDEAAEESEEPLSVEVAARALADHCPRPVYPRRAQRMGWSGTVVCSMNVAADGSVAGVEILQSSGHALLDETVLRTVHAWRFAPATRDGVARPCRVVRRFRFDLPS